MGNEDGALTMFCRLTALPLTISVRLARNSVLAFATVANPGEL